MPKGLKCQCGLIARYVETSLQDDADDKHRVFVIVMARMIREGKWRKQ